MIGAQRFKTRSTTRSARVLHRICTRRCRPISDPEPAGLRELDARAEPEEHAHAMNFFDFRNDRNGTSSFRRWISRRVSSPPLMCSSRR
jgi:hypothetical protein